MNSRKIIQDILFYLFLAITVIVLVFTTTQNERRSSEKEIFGVHVKGAVNAPGYYELPEGSRYKDALIAAGGETADANLEELNLATIILDGEEIIIASKNSTKSNSTGKININTADLYKLCKLEGIGEATAQKIIDYRSSKGPFTSIKDLKKVSGIGESKFKIIENLITVE